MRSSDVIDRLIQDSAMSNDDADVDDALLLMLFCASNRLFLTGNNERQRGREQESEKDI